MTSLDEDRAADLIAVVVQRAREVARAQAALAAAMVEFAAVRRGLDAERIDSIEALGQPARYSPGEFAADEIGLAVAGSTWQVQRTAALTRRVQTHLPSVWDAWVAGDVDQDKVRRIDAGLRRLQREDSRHLLDQTVVDVAVGKAPELLGRWVNRLVAHLEPDGHDDRSRAAYRERYVSVRADLDGMSHVYASVTSMDAAAVDAGLTTLATSAEARDPRSMQQRRADALWSTSCSAGSATRMTGRIRKAISRTARQQNRARSPDARWTSTRTGSCPPRRSGRCPARTTWPSRTPRARRHHPGPRVAWDGPNVRPAPSR